MYGFGIAANWKGLDVNVHFQGTGKSSFFVEGATVYAFSQGEWGNILSRGSFFLIVGSLLIFQVIRRLKTRMLLILV